MGMNDGVSTQFRINCLINQKRIQNEGVGKKFPTPSFFNKCSGFFLQKRNHWLRFTFFSIRAMATTTFATKSPFLVVNLRKNQVRTFHIIINAFYESGWRCGGRIGGLFFILLCFIVLHAPF